MFRENQRVKLKIGKRTLYRFVHSVTDHIVLLQEGGTPFCSKTGVALKNTMVRKSISPLNSI